MISPAKTKSKHLSLNDKCIPSIFARQHGIFFSNVCLSILKLRSTPTTLLTLFLIEAANNPEPHPISKTLYSFFKYFCNKMLC